MTEPTVRVLVLIGVGLVVVAFWWWERRTGAKVRIIPPPGLEPGVTLFASETCDSCRAARRVLGAVVGSGYREVTFEDDPPGFGRYGIARVPSIVLVEPDGKATLVEGVPSRRTLRRLLA
jgi:hypothetical protein